MEGGAVLAMAPSSEHALFAGRPLSVPPLSPEPPAPPPLTGHSSFSGTKLCTLPPSLSHATIRQREESAKAAAAVVVGCSSESTRITVPSSPVVRPK